LNNAEHFVVVSAKTFWPKTHTMPVPRNGKYLLWLLLVGSSVSPPEQQYKKPSLGQISCSAALSRPFGAKYSSKLLINYSRISASQISANHYPTTSHCQKKYLKKY
jgi:hypothetical protein